MNVDALAEAVSAILKHSEDKKRGFVETIELQFALKNYDPNKYVSYYTISNIHLDGT